VEQRYENFRHACRNAQLQARNDPDMAPDFAA
jgi:hypothetical protein